MNNWVLNEGERLDDLVRGDMKIIQRPDQFCFSLDSILAAHYVSIRKKDRIADLGTGTGVIALLLSTLGGEDITAFEINPVMADLARRNVNGNNKSDCIKVVECDYRNVKELYPTGSFDSVVVNPPYREIGTGRMNHCKGVASASYELNVTLEDIFHTAQYLLKYGGRLTMVHRADRLVDLITLGRRYKMEAKRIRPVDLIAAEDTRHTRILLNHFQISGHVVSYHEHNKKESGNKLIEALKSGRSVAQCSDAGMPVISDPGSDLVRLAIEAEIPVVPLPGPNAALTALIASGLDARQFAFIGFLPKINAKKKKLLFDMSHIPVTLIFYEAPHRLKETLETLIRELGNRKAVLAKELTKRFETFKRSMLQELLDDLETEIPRGEYVILVEGWNEISAEEKEQKTGWREEAVSFALKMPLKEAARQVSFKHHLSRREVYQYLLNQKEADANK